MKKIIKRILLIILIVIILLLAIYVKIGHDMYKEKKKKKSIETMVAEIKAKENYTTIDKLPEDYKNAVIAVEDRRFYLHRGIDIISIGRAIFTDIVSFELKEGGSTITQQLAKNTYFTQSKNFSRKVAEIYVALDYEKKYSKAEILELYLNYSYFGGGNYCVGDATKYYFNKTPDQMDLYESTLLAGIPNAPSVYDPKKNPDLAWQRQKQVLRKMIRANYLTQEQADEILKIKYNERYN